MNCEILYLKKVDDFWNVEEKIVMKHETDTDLDEKIEELMKKHKIDLHKAYFIDEDCNFLRSYTNLADDKLIVAFREGDYVY
jgi:hypothetical protein